MQIPVLLQKKSDLPDVEQVPIPAQTLNKMIDEYMVYVSDKLLQERVDTEADDSNQQL